MSANASSTESQIKHAQSQTKENKRNGELSDTPQIPTATLNSIQDSSATLKINTDTEELSLDHGMFQDDKSNVASPRYNPADTKESADTKEKHVGVKQDLESKYDRDHNYNTPQATPKSHWATPSASRKQSIAEPPSPKMGGSDLSGAVKALAQKPAVAHRAVAPRGASNVPNHSSNQEAIQLMRKKKMQNNSNTRLTRLEILRDPKYKLQFLVVNQLKSEPLNNVGNASIPPNNLKADLLQSQHDALLHKNEAEKRLGETLQKDYESALERIRQLEGALATANNTIGINAQTIVNLQNESNSRLQTIETWKNAHTVACKERDSLKR